MQENKKKQGIDDFGQGKIVSRRKNRKHDFKLALPLVVSQIINVLYNIVDRIYVGNMPEVGREALAGLGIAIPIIMIVSASAALFGSGGAPIASILLGEGKKEEARQTMMNSFVLLVAAGIFLTLVTLAFDAELLRLFGAEAEAMGYAKDYLDYYALGTVFVMISIGMTAFITAQGLSKIAMLSVSLGALLNIVLNPVFIYALGLGVKGAALASAVSQAASAVFALAFLSGKKPLRFGFRKFRFRKRTVVAIMALGVSSFIMNATGSLVQIVFKNQIGKYSGENYTLYINLISIMLSVTVIVLPLSVFVQGAAPFISYNYGSGRIDRVREAAWFLIKICLLYSLGFYMLICFPKSLRLYSIRTRSFWKLRLLISGYSSWEWPSSASKWPARTFSWS